MKISIYFPLLCLSLFFTLNGQEVLWKSRIDLGSEEDAKGIAIDSAGNIFLAGNIATPPLNCDLLLIKCNPQGETIWTRRYGDSIPTEDCFRITADPEGNIYIAGYCMPSPLEGYGLLLKYSNDGELLWVKEHWLPPWDIVFLDVVTDNQNNIFVAGVVDSFTPEISPQKGLLCRYDSAGNLLWAKEYNWAKYFLGITQGSNGNLYLASEDQFDQMLTVCVDTSGDTIWTRRYNGGESYSRGQGIAVDSLGNVIVTGFVEDTMQYYDITTIKYTQNGDTVWTRRVNFFPYEYDWGFDVATDNFGNIYVGGNIGGDYLNPDYFLIKYTPEGETVWTRRYCGYGAHSYNFTWSIAVDRSNNPIITGQSEEDVGIYDIVTIKYRGTMGIEEERLPPSADRQPLRIYPNPAGVEQTVRFACRISESDSPEIRVYDVSGKLIRVISLKGGNGESEIQNGDFSLKEITPGTYFIRIGTKTTKLIIVGR